jgi:N-acetylmuramoyl-L-alanine amidase
MGKRGRFFRNKRAIGSMILLEAMQLLAVILILTGSIMYVNNKLNKVGFYKGFFARDFGLMTTTLYAAPGNVLMFYDIFPPGETESVEYGFGFKVSDNFVNVNATTAAGYALYWYFSSFGMYPIRFEDSFEPNAALLRIGKEGNAIKMAKPGGSFVKGTALACPFVQTTEKGWLDKSFIFDAAHGDNKDDKGAVNEADRTFYESEVTMDIANKVGVIQMGNRLLIREKGKYIPFLKRAGFISENADEDTMIISIHTGNNPDESVNHIKAYYNILSGEDARKRSRKLGCEILNSIARKKDLKNVDNINGIAVIPSDSDYIQRIIPAGKIGVLLELGNMQIPRNNNFLPDSTALAGAIYEGIAAYHAGGYDE